MSNNCDCSEGPDTAAIGAGVGVLGPEAFPPAPFLELLAEYGSPHGEIEVPLA